MTSNQRIFVSLTSWTKRIDNVKFVVETMLNQTLIPHKVIINLCIQDFPQYEEDLPNDLLEFIDNHKDKVEIYWYIENYKGWKKHLHVLEIVNDSDLIISVDDDFVYPSNFIENLYRSYIYYGKKYPITNNNIELTANCWSFYGPGTLYWRNCLPKNYKKYLTKDVLHCRMEDYFMLFLFCMNNTIILPNKFKTDVLEEYNSISPMTIGTDPEVHDAIIKEYTEAFNNCFAEKYFNNEPQRYYPLFWNILEKYHEYCKTIKNPFPELQFAIDYYEYNFLLQKSERVSGDWIPESLHLNIDMSEFDDIKNKREE